MSVCAKCGSPYHNEKICLKAASNRRSYGFKTGRQMGLKPGEVPFKYRVDINTDFDGETEISNKRALLRLNTQRIYTQMGCAAQAANNLTAAYKWLTRLLENMDDDERAKVEPLLVSMTESLTRMTLLKQEKIEQAVQMEKIGEESYAQARKARVRMDKAKKDKVKKSNEFGILRLGNTEMNLPVIGSGQPLEMFQFPAEKEVEPPTPKA